MVAASKLWSWSIRITMIIIKNTNAQVLSRSNSPSAGGETLESNSEAS